MTDTNAVARNAIVAAFSFADRVERGTMTQHYRDQAAVRLAIAEVAAALAVIVEYNSCRTRCGPCRLKVYEAAQVIADHNAHVLDSDPVMPKKRGHSHGNHV